MGQKVYVMPIVSTAIGTAVQDICSLLTGASNGIQIHHIHFDANVSTEAALRIRLKRGTGVTQGSGGSGGTAQPTDATDPVLSGVTIHLNDTSQATGTFLTLGEFYWDVSLPFDHAPIVDEDRETCTVSQALVIDLPATITSTTISGYIKFRILP